MVTFQAHSYEQTAAIGCWSMLQINSATQQVSTGTVCSKMVPTGWMEARGLHSAPYRQEEASRTISPSAASTALIGITPITAPNILMVLLAHSSSTLRKKSRLEKATTMTRSSYFRTGIMILVQLCCPLILRAAMRITSQYQITGSFRGRTSGHPLHHFRIELTTLKLQLLLP